MDYRTVNNEENDGSDENEQVLSPFFDFETHEDENNNEKRMQQFSDAFDREFFLFLLESKWSHQQDLDDFFVQVYQYHQKHGFFCIAISEIFGLM